ncbi:MAG TPA: hypothetical protein DEG17_09220 [Cyanobacteria bacterium UBA11149]|nr:hypothetical protein [Cyanobacteria bacterium UBA11367]HBE57510.1 hypothetical protein [Cyanobacteria bacterium UBA11366]HBR73604.1 hypothetical protein [Cyanobacteria bacterium UBA11159]HBW89030.1 hypothetical protein [Cyanobacteria bacterium UBA11149]HCA96734.1 hypothetical protein [Cyanobacteria bacterium UBA9226]
MSYLRKKVALKKTHRFISKLNHYQVKESSIEEKKTAELESLRILYESIPCIYFTLNAKGMILSVSDFGADYLGYDSAELSQKSIIEVFYGEDRGICQEQLIQLPQESSGLSQWEARLVRKDSRILWVKAIARGVPGTELNPMVSLVCEDITATKEQSAALADCEECWRVNFDRAAIGMVHCDLQGRFLRVNQTFCKLVGYDREELLSRTFQDITYSEDLPIKLEFLASLLTGKLENYSIDNRYIRKDGTLIWVNKTIFVGRDKSKNPQHLVAVIKDISQRKLAEQELRWKEALLEAMTGSSPLGFYVVDDRTDRILYFNHCFCEIWGIEHLEKQMEEGKLKNKDIIASGLPLLADDPEFVASHTPRQRRENKAIVEDEIPFVNGRTIRRFSAQIRDESNGYFGRLYIFEDITGRKLSEEALQQQFIKERLVGAIAKRIHQSLDIDQILNTTVAEVRQIIACDRVIVFRMHEDGSGVVVVESVESGWKPISGTVINDRYFAEIYVQLYQQGRVQSIEDIYTAGLTECHINLLEDFQVRANLVVPIVQEDKLWGLLVAQQCSKPRQWQTWEVNLLKALSTHTAIAIQQSELYQQAQTEIAQRQQAEIALRQQFQREQLLGAITRRIRQSLNFREILQATVAEVRQILQTDRVIIFRFLPDWSGDVVVESSDSNCRPILGSKIYDRCFQEVYVSPYKQGRIQSVEDIYNANLSQCHIDLLANFQVRANLVVPLLNGEELWGLLVAHHCRQPRQWQPFEIDLLQQLASQVAIAIQQSQLYEQTQSLFLREQAINRVTQAIRASLDLNTIFLTTVKEIVEVLEVELAQIIQYLPEENIWLILARSQKQLDIAMDGLTEISDDQNPIAEQLKKGKIVRINDRNEEKDKLNKAVDQIVPGSWLLVPLQFGAAVWGCITLANNLPHYWQDSEVELICGIADQVAIALQQAQLYNQSRTAEEKALTQAQKLEEALEKLQKTHAQLLQSEKMSSLGQLVAGVAHEINNPISFIYGNVVHAKDYTENLLSLIELYQKEYPNPPEEIAEKIEEIEIDFLVEDLRKLLNSMLVGAQRICEIVGSLRNFSRVSEAEMKAVDIREGIESTLMILQNRLKAKGDRPEIQVIREYEDLPQVQCYAGQLNQVFMNLIVNAIDAIEEQIQWWETQLSREEAKAEIKANSGKIWIKTALVNDEEVAIRIADNGLGMTEQVKQQLFDPFFTTKPVGAGTGLGLSISYQIVVEKHGGKLSCQSQFGDGTEFVIQIPLRQEGFS